jgi:hypothetical protein
VLAKGLGLTRSSFRSLAFRFLQYSHNSIEKLAIGLMMDRRSHLSTVSPVYNHLTLWGTGYDPEIDSFYGARECCLRVALTVHATDPRDIVFALRSIFPDTLGRVAVDYNTTIEDIYIEAAKCVILHERNPLNTLELLQHK